MSSPPRTIRALTQDASRRQAETCLFVKLLFVVQSDTDPIMQIDDVDRRLLRFFQSQPGASAAELAALVGLPRSTCWRRLERLEAAGVIAGVEAIIDWRALGFAVEVALRITLDKTERNAFDTFLAAAREVPEVTEIQTFLGRVDVRLNVLARDMSHYQEIYRSRILNLPHILDIEQLMLISDVKTDEALPV